MVYINDEITHTTVLQRDVAGQILRQWRHYDREMLNTQAEAKKPASTCVHVPVMLPFSLYACSKMI